MLASDLYLGRTLDAAGDDPVYLFIHHPPFALGLPALDSMGLADTGPFERAIAHARNLRHIFFGHVHRPVSGSWRGIPFSALRSTVHQVPLDFETAAPVPYNHESPAYAVILIDDGRTVVHHHCYLDDSRVPPGRARLSASLSSSGSGLPPRTTTGIVPCLAAA